MLELVISRGGKELVALPLGDGRLRIGRAGTNDISLPEPTLSRHQCLLLAKPRGLTLEDKSGRGTVVDGRPVRRAELQPGSRLGLGTLTAEVRESTGDTPVPTMVRGGETMVIGARNADSPGLLLTGKLGKRLVHLPLEGQVLTIGQDPANDLVLGDKFVSAFHCRLTARNGQWFVTDLDSTNGTKVNQVTVGEARLEPGMKLQLGRVVLQVESAEKQDNRQAFQGLVSADPAMRPVFDTIRRAAPSNETILITGESGTGKEMVARACHRLSPRHERPLLALNCAAISRELMESELFGHEKGAFTGAQTRRLGMMEEAHLGTLFLDEIGELALDLQAKLLRALESGEIRRVGSNQSQEVDVRILAATHRSLPERVQDGEFREDLFYRLCVIEVKLPPLRKRRKDIPLLAEYFLQQATAQTDNPKHFSAGALKALQQYPFPGNVRELKHIVTRAAILCESDEIAAADLAFAPPSLADRVAEARLYHQARSLREVEIEAICQALAVHEGNQRAVARALGIARSTLLSKIDKYNINPEDYTGGVAG